jgi:hypothetical protein
LKHVKIHRKSCQISSIFSKGIGFLNRNEEPVEQSPESKSPSVDIDIFDSVDNEAYKVPEQEEEVEFEWEVEEILMKEEIITDKIKLYPSYKSLEPDNNFLSSLKPYVDPLNLETPEFKFHIHDSNINWKLYDGFDGNRSSMVNPYDCFDDEQPKYFERRSHQVEIHFLNIDFSLLLYPPTTFVSKQILLKIRDVEILDNVQSSQWKKFLTCMVLGEDEPRETDGDMVFMKMVGVRVENREEVRLKIALSPIQMYIDQDTVIFLESYFSKNPKESSTSPRSSTTDPKKMSSATSPTVTQDLFFFQKFDIDPISIEIDYKAKHVDYNNLQHFKLIEMINFLSLDGAKFYLKQIQLTGIKSWEKILTKTLEVWLPHIKQTQLPHLASGITGIRSIVNIGTGIADLVLLPIEQFKKDGRIVRGILY